MRILYSFLVYTVIIFSPLIIIYRILKKKENPKRFLEKFSINKKKRSKGKLIWFHCSSVGEFLSVVPLIKEFEKIAGEVNGKFNVNYSDEIPNVAIFVSKQNHCLIDLLWRVRNGELKMKVPLIISNHSDLENIANDFNAKFVHINTFKIDKSIVEDQFLNLLKEYEIDLVVLAKYMQILSDSFLKKFSSIINIHHSFLPAFKGGQPYHRAWKRGVKLIGATAHYVTEDLDEGPIIEQCTVNVSHRDEVDDLIRKGRDIERIALARAVRLHLNHQVFVYNSKTAVFD